ncbi:hypothetical protein B9G98_04327 [Wickerhamiella sorbophila]|uniref:Sugar kinase n=1 Tax=Wickerhamiella sorbophila TaxID=45607 RepID=A0A2T0FNZ7_9ASCO|nr:hypothetical protein B9G98_04327 [Wickerhamiella sorbophila]PRT56707.1 hypothetical protein B9G98_04327 [Wickerhamiella sorbophila]
MYIGIDVGTGSARACIMDESGEIVALASKDIKRWEPKQDYFNQSVADIWEAACYCTKKALKDANVEPAQIKGLAFDATCSLVVCDDNLEPIAVGPNWEDSTQNIILWMDHRAPKETDEIAATNHSLLKYVGGKMSIEMEIPKIMWLKRNMPEGMFAKCHFYDLGDYLTDRATGVNARSFNSVVCKQGFVPQGVDGSKDGWNSEFFDEVGLGELKSDHFKRMGGVPGVNGVFHSPGEKVGNLCQKAAEELGLTTSTVVGSGIIDAYSGWIGTVAAKSDSAVDKEDFSSRLAAVAGTSTCHIVVSKDPIFVPGVWGPYRDSLIPGMWCAEGGQSTTGELLHFVLTTHPAHTELEAKADQGGLSKFDILNDLLGEMRKQKSLDSVILLSKDLFFYGDLYGNRSPIADPAMRGSITGISMDTSLENLAITYLATVEFICQQTRQIIEAMVKAGHEIKTIYLSGGQCRNKLLVQLLADATQCPVVIPKYIDAAVVFGTAILAAQAASPGKSLLDVMKAYSCAGRCVHPESKDSLTVKLLDTKYEIFLDQADRQRKYRALVSQALSR